MLCGASPMTSAMGPISRCVERVKAGQRITSKPCCGQNFRHSNEGKVLRFYSDLTVSNDVPGKMTLSDKSFIRELVDVMEPVATCLDKLQETDSPLGMLIPRVLQLHSVLEDEMPKKRLLFCRPLVDALLEELDRRYGLLIRCDLNDAFTKDCALSTFSTPGSRPLGCRATRPTSS